MNELDEKIRAALKAEDAQVLSEFDGDAPMHELVMDLYRGQRRWLNGFIMTSGCLVFAAQLWCGYRFFGAESTHEMIGWATGFLTLFIWLVMLKFWFWLELLRNSVSREVKRLELQVALLNKHAEADTEGLS